MQAKYYKMEENNFDRIIAATDKVLMFPSTTLKDACSEFGIKFPSSIGYVAEGVLCQSLVLLLATWAFGKYKKNQRDKAEMGRMKNEVIRKQQAIINKLKSENQLNQEEIKNLKDTLEMLEGLLNQVNRA